MTSKDAKRPQKALMRPNEIKYVPNNAKCVSNNVKCVTKYAKALMNGVKSAGGVQMRSKQSQNAFQAEQKLRAAPGVQVIRHKRLTRQAKIPVILLQSLQAD